LCERQRRFRVYKVAVAPDPMPIVCDAALPKP